MDSRVETIVIGGGISGLVCAYRLKQLGIDVRLIEASDQIGGVIRSETIDGYLIERGPNSSQGTEELMALVEELGMMDQLLEGDPRAPAYVYFSSRLHAVPSGPGAFITSTLLSTGGKIRLLAEPFIKVRRSSTEESVASFAARRIGKEAAERLVAPFVSGIYAGDANQLSVQAAFPKLANLEANYGGLFRGTVAKVREARRARKSAGDVMARAAPTRRRLVSFKNGMATLPGVLAARLGEDLLTGARDCKVARANQASGAEGLNESRIAVQFSHSGGSATFTADAVVIATPANAAARLLAGLQAELCNLLSEIPYPELAVVHLAYDLESINRELDGFGFLVAPAEPLNILGCVWNSSLFPGRAPAGKALLTVFAGGARKPELVTLRDGELVSLIHNDLKVVLGISADPKIISVTRYEKAIPQYNLGHAARVSKIESLLEETPGLYLTGNYLHGVSTGDCIKQAEQVASRIATGLRS